MPNSARNVRTIRTAAAFSSGLYLRVVGFPGDCSFGIAPSSFPRSGASRISRAIHVAGFIASAIVVVAVGIWYFTQRRSSKVTPSGNTPTSPSWRGWLYRDS
ncbi:hypothetical protein I549_5081 [Mycobacterium avium subsp. avium 2285 (R)]|nr:hypothetical protein I549_5081 [Mycobacterium avium subsp. avium 2285 (R)]